MPSYNKFQSFVENVNEKVHNLGADSLKVMLVNSPAPVNTNTVKANLTEITPGNGYTAGGHAVPGVTSSQSSGTYKLVGGDVIITAAGGSIGPFQYAVLYNDTATNDELIAWWDNGTPITLGAGESVTIDFDPTNGIFQMT